jgi:hypothetical protein
MLGTVLAILGLITFITGLFADGAPLASIGLLSLTGGGWMLIKAGQMLPSVRPGASPANPSQELAGETAPAPSTAPPAGERQSESAPLTITITKDYRTIQYCEGTADATLNALRTDILQGTLLRDAETSIKTKTRRGKFTTIDGTLLKCALRYPQLVNLYMPVRQHARVGMLYGIGAGVLLQLALLGLSVFQANQTLGALILLAIVCFAVGPFLLTSKINIPILPVPVTLAAIIIPAYLSFNGLFPMLLGAAFSGALLFSMPGMAIGAAVGAIRRPHLARANDAPQENATLRIAIPLAIAAVLWTAYLLWARSFLMRELPGTAPSSP